MAIRQSRQQAFSLSLSSLRPCLCPYPYLYLYLSLSAFRQMTPARRPVASIRWITSAVPLVMSYLGKSSG